LIIFEFIFKIEYKIYNFNLDGGWQDQVGGILGGVINTVAQKDLPLTFQMEKLKLSNEMKDEINNRLVLVYTVFSF
jgi:galactokinase/mevalonate kinase-like predicted kinase